MVVVPAIGPFTSLDLTQLLSGVVRCSTLYAKAFPHVRRLSVLRRQFNYELCSPTDPVRDLPTRCPIRRRNSTGIVASVELLIIYRFMTDVKFVIVFASNCDSNSL